MIRDGMKRNWRIWINWSRLQTYSL